MYLSLFLAFICGILFNVFWGYLLGLGFGSIAFKNSMADCLLLLAKNVQSTIEIQELKYVLLRDLDRPSNYIEFQKHLDKREVDSLKNTLIRNYINSVPPRYNSLVEFHDWDTAMAYLNEAFQGAKND